MKLKEVIQGAFSWIKNELKNDENNELFQKELLEPLVQTILTKIYPYLIVSSAAFLLVFIGVISILVLLFQIPRISVGKSALAQIGPSIPDTLAQGLGASI